MKNFFHKQVYKKKAAKFDFLSPATVKYVGWLRQNTLDFEICFLLLIIVQWDIHCVRRVKEQSGMLVLKLEVKYGFCFDLFISCPRLGKIFIAKCACYLEACLF